MKSLTKSTLAQIATTLIVLGLTVYVLTSRFVKTPMVVKRNTDLVVVFVVSGIVLSVFMDALPLAIVLACVGIVLVASSLNPKPKSSGLVKPSYVSNHRYQKKNVPLVLKTQSNVFNKLNYDLYYNEMGEQYNIQGINEVYPNGYEPNTKHAKTSLPAKLIT